MPGVATPLSTIFISLLHTMALEEAGEAITTAESDTELKLATKAPIIKPRELTELEQWFYRTVEEKKPTVIAVQNPLTTKVQKKTTSNKSEVVNSQNIEPNAPPKRKYLERTEGNLDLINEEDDTRFEEDLQYYFSRVTSAELLSPEEEFALATDIVSKRKEWRKLVLTSNFAQRKALILLQDTLSKAMLKKMEMPSDEEENIKKADDICTQLQAFLPLAENYVTEDTRAATKEIHKIFSRTEEKAEETTTIHAEDVIEMMEQQGKLRNEEIQTIMQEMEILLQTFEAYRTQWATPQACPELQHLIEQNLILPEDLANIVTENRKFYKQWKEVSHQMMLANTRLVVSIAKKYRGRSMPFRDLISEGILGLMRAIDKFKPELGFRFSTYATRWIRAKISKGIYDKSKMIRLTRYGVSVQRKISTLIQQHSHEHQGERPSYEMIGEKLALKPETILRTVQTTTVASIDQLFGEDRSLQEILPDKKASDAFTGANIQEQRDALCQALRSLHPEERDIIILRCGLGLIELPREEGDTQIRFAYDEKKYGIEYTFEEIGQMKGSSREWIRQIEEGALKKLRNTNHPLRIALFRQDQNVEKPTLAKIDSNVTSLAELGIAKIILNLLEKIDIFTVKDYLKVREDNIKIPRMGKLYLQEVDEAVGKFLVEQDRYSVDRSASMHE